MSQEVLVVNESTVVSDAQVQEAVTAIQIQLNRDFAPIWGVSLNLKVWPKSSIIPAGSWEMVVLDNSDQAGALGYHELTVNGDPLGKVFAKDCIDDGVSWTVDLSHETLEMAADPYINDCVENDTATGIRFYAKEVCDTCEDDPFGYHIVFDNEAKKVLVSDFVYPQWFAATETGLPSYDFTGHVKAPLQLLENGYIGYIDVSSADGWQQLLGSMADEKAKARAVPTDGHRRYLRATPRQNWSKSTAHAS